MDTRYVVSRDFYIARLAYGIWDKQAHWWASDFRSPCKSECEREAARLNDA
jgi:hypothetical protein